MSEDPFDKYVSQFTQPTQRWMRDHKEWVTDGAKSQQLQRAHFSALAEGLDVDSPAYFDHVEQKIGIRDSDGGGVIYRRVPREEPKVTLSQREAAAATDGTHRWITTIRTANSKRTTPSAPKSSRAERRK
jgi:hypothetical protein